ncbi:MAG: GAF domain-containing protein [Sphingobacterium sp.]
MAEDLAIVKGSKEEQYINLLPQIKGLLTGENNQVANMGNICAALKEQFDFFWVGFYLVEGDELVLGPFQGPVACTRIAYERGVCGTAWANKQTLIVDDVDQFPGHIACNTQSRSEIVLPLFKNEKCIGILDVDSSTKAAFDQTDATYLQKIINLYVNT